MSIVYESFAEPDPGRVGFYADGVRPLMVKRADKTEEIVYPARTVVIDKFLQSPQESAKLLFRFWGSSECVEQLYAHKNGCYK